MRRPCLIGLLVVLACFGTARALAAEDSAERLPVPNSAAQTKIASSIRSQYKEDYARRTAADQLALAQRLRQQAAAAEGDPVRQYVLLREARELAVNAGELEVAFAIIDQTARAFTVEPDELKSTALANSMDRALVSKPELFERYLKLCDAALDRGDLQMANQADVLALAVARTSRDRAMALEAKPYDLRVHEARREYTSVIAAANKLKSSPDDADASLTVGRYLCFSHRRWDEGLPLLAHGSDKRLRELATRDVEGPNDAPAMASLADDWWGLPDSRQAPQRRARERAAYWYEHALDRLTGEAKARAAQRIEATKTQSRPALTTEPAQ